MCFKLPLFAGSMMLINNNQHVFAQEDWPSVKVPGRVGIAVEVITIYFDALPTLW